MLLSLLPLLLSLLPLLLSLLSLPLLLSLLPLLLSLLSLPCCCHCCRCCCHCCHCRCLLGAKDIAKLRRCQTRRRCVSESDASVTSNTTEVFSHPSLAAAISASTIYEGQTEINIESPGEQARAEGYRTTAPGHQLNEVASGQDVPAEEAASARSPSNNDAQNIQYLLEENKRTAKRLTDVENENKSLKEMMRKLQDAIKGKPFPSPSSVAVPESDPVNEERESSSSEEAELEEAHDL
ncbi:uncharacterized protein [Watersipora subatra]|uniref:uncharacterized protein n=1 Tax=Watersipora subatra TaxID=2589382 RepID=UPI00355B85BC